MEEVNQVLNKYGTFEKVLGTGSFGEVLEYRKGNMASAIKKLSLQNIEYQFILQEIMYLQELKGHNNIVQLKEVIVDFIDNNIYLVQELADGSLTSFIPSFRSGKYPEFMLKQIFYDVGLALLTLRNHNILHRDIKPDNILIKFNNGMLRGVLADFGISQGRICQNKEPLILEVYTFKYRSIEILLSDVSYSFPAEIWALAITMYYTVTSKFPFIIDDSIETDDLYELQEKLIDAIYDLRGTPTDQDWPNFKKLRYGSLEKKESNWFQLVSEYQGLFSENSLFLNLLDKMLILNPEIRINILSYLTDPFFDDPSIIRNDLLVEEGFNSCLETLDLNDFYPSNYLSSLNSNQLEKRKSDLMELRKQSKIYSVPKDFGMACLIYDSYYSYILGQKIDFPYSEQYSLFLLACLDLASTIIYVPINIYQEKEIVERIEKEISSVLNFHLNASLVTDYANILLSSYSRKVRTIFNNMYQEIYLTDLPFQYKARYLTLFLINRICDQEGETFLHFAEIQNYEYYQELKSRIDLLPLK